MARDGVVVGADGRARCWWCSGTPESTALSKDLKKRGWTYVGPTTVYAFMQAMGLVNDHLDGCVVRAEIAPSPPRGARARG